ncbi:hypothetical protein GP486_006239 [Trichoglossum hirsutum]|uniref:Uncharacterized protein n=1 Tax=Trichoglossum hirsutum TaxID=265104 RepID=A0A9P8L7K0_9PEZI|nr:hypothetical protein GP486_006239 [Trichoglossum hirsutum]
MKRSDRQQPFSGLFNKIQAANKRQPERPESGINPLRGVRKDEINNPKRQLQEQAAISAKEMERLKLSHEAEVSELRLMHEAERNHIMEMMSRLKHSHEDEVGKLRQPYEEKIMPIMEEMERLEHSHKDYVGKLQQKHKEEMASTMDKMRLLAHEYEDRISMLNRDFEEYRVKMQTDFQRQSQEMASSFEAKMSSAIKSQRETYEARLTDLKRQSNDVKQRMATEHETERAAMIGELEEEKMSMMESMQGIREAHEAEKRRIEERHDAEIAALEIKREREIKSLRESIENLKGALLRRDSFKGMSGHELTHRFQDLASDVDDLARVQWDNKLEPTWPFPNKLLRNSENERRSKQHIVQNTFWVILYEKIFCTPFRVLGNEGKSLEREWIEKYGQDRKSIGGFAPCPRPTKDSEKWRYETIKKRLEAISQPLVAGEPNYDVKRDHELSVTKVTEDMSQALERVASVSDGDIQRMSDLVRKAAKLWLEVGQQRCRIYLLMSDPSEEPSQSGQTPLDRDRVEKLVVVPELRRIGNVQGGMLEKDELISGCKGKFSVFHVC